MWLDPESHIELSSVVFTGDNWERTNINHVREGWTCEWDSRSNPCVMCWFDVGIDVFPWVFEADDSSKFKISTWYQHFSLNKPFWPMASSLRVDQGALNHIVESSMVPLVGDVTQTYSWRQT